MFLSPRCFSFQGKAAMRALKLGLAVARCDARLGEMDLRAINVVDEFPPASMTFPSLRSVPTQRSAQLVNEHLNLQEPCLAEAPFSQERGTAAYEKTPRG
jgi:hypothetical protein